MTTRATHRTATRATAGVNGLKRSAFLMAAMLLLACGADRARGGNAYWWGATSAEWSGNNWSSTDASSGAVFTPYTPVAGDSLLWYWSATSNTTGNNDLTGFSAAALDFRRTPSAITLDGNPLTMTGDIKYGSGHTIDLDLVLEDAYFWHSRGNGQRRHERVRRVEKCHNHPAG